MLPFQNVTFLVKRLSSTFIEILTKEDNLIEKLKVTMEEIQRLRIFMEVIDRRQNSRDALLYFLKHYSTGDRLWQELLW